ncbi:hypothetical protein ACTFIZ_005208 [Dictyostelium cf. discoideum]
MKSYFIILIFLLNFSIFFKYCNSQVSSGPLYNVNINNIIYDQFGTESYNINYYPTSTNLSYTGENFYSLDKNRVKAAKVTLTSDCILNGNTASITDCIYTITSQQSGSDNVPNIFPPSDSLLLVKGNVTLVVPSGITLTISGSPNTIPALVIKGRLLLDPNNNTTFSFYKMQILPNGIFESTPINSKNHTIIATQIINENTAQWDRNDIPSILSIDGNVTIRGFDSSSTWTGYDPKNGTTFMRSFPFTYDKLPIIKLGGLKDVKGTEQYKLNSFYTNMIMENTNNKYAFDQTSGTDTGFILINHYNKNVWIKGIGKCSMVFTGSSTVDIKNSVFYDFGHTTSLPLDENNNIPNRYPITLYHNKKSVNIENNCFLGAIHIGTPQQSLTPRSFIGAIRSFGNIIGNSFVLKESLDGLSMSGISLLYGTEQFNVNYNSFISFYTSTSSILPRGQYPDNINYINSGIISTSPYSFFESNIFEGRFKGGSFNIIPLQSRSTIASLNSDKLIGIYNGFEQSNINDKVSNTIWNKVVFKDNVFFGESEFRVTYPMSIQPPIKINFLRGWHINQRPSVVLPPNEANVDFTYDSSLVQFDLNPINKNFGETNNLKGKCNSVSIKNSNFSSSYIFFSESFKCNYISIVDSKFTHMIHVGNSTVTFIKRFANQIYLSNVNGTRIHRLSGLYGRLYPFFQLSPMSIIDPPLTQNSINFTFIPNSESPTINRPSILETIIDEDFQNNSNIDPIGNQIHSKFIQFQQNANGPYTVVLSSKPIFPNITGYEKLDVGPYFAGTYIVDNSANNFYLGIDLSPPPPPPPISSPPRSLSIFGKQWTKCSWIQTLNKCTTTGVFTPNSSMTFIPSEITENDEISMITSYLGNDITNNIPSTVNISLAGPHQYKFYLYSYNSDWTDSIVNPIPSFSIKINDKYQEPITRSAPTYLTYKKYGPFYWNNLNSTEQILSIKWANENIKYSIPLSGIEIFSSIQTSFQIPISP